MYVYIVQLDSTREISEKTVQTFMVITDEDVIRILSENDPDIKRVLYDMLADTQKKEIDLYINIMMNQHFQKNRDYLLVSSRQSLSRLQLVHHVAKIEDIKQHLLVF